MTCVDDALVTVPRTIVDVSAVAVDAVALEDVSDAEVSAR
jgi:hypothetical protein